MYRLSLSSSVAEPESNFFPARSPIAFTVAGVVMAWALTFLIFGSFLSSQVAGFFGAEYLDVRPSWQGTVSTSSVVYQNNMLFGSGPATFSTVWSSSLDEGVNESLFWNTDFAFGIGIVPTAFITTGIVGGSAWLALIIAWGYGVVQFLRSKPQDILIHAISVAWLAVSGYLLALVVLYVPSMVMMAYTAIALGAFLSTLVALHIVHAPVFSYTHTRAGAFVGPTMFGLLALSIVVVFVQGVRPVLASSYIARAASALTANDVSRAQGLAATAETLAPHDESARLMTSAVFSELAALLQQTPDAASADREQVQSLIERVVSYAQEVPRRFPHDFRNWLFLANVYEQLSGVVGEEALKSAAVAYQEARIRAPKSPLVPLLQARLANAQNDTEGARAFIQESLALKKNYTDAYFLLSQIEIKEGNTQEAIRSTESAVLLAPSNPGLRFQLGFLLYAGGAYEDAAKVLQTAVTLNPQYANALYFLGLSFDRLGQSEPALEAFSKVLELNPENEEVKAIVSGLEQGVSAVETLSSLQSVPPAERTELPVSEEPPVVE